MSVCRVTYNLLTLDCYVHSLQLLRLYFVDSLSQRMSMCDHCKCSAQLKAARHTLEGFWDTTPCAPS
jgi:hypothetical protein